MIPMKITQNIEEKLRDCREGSWRDSEQDQPVINYHSKEENPDWNRFWSHDSSPDDPHEFGECMENWHDYAWRKEQEEMDSKKRKG